MNLKGFIFVVEMLRWGGKEDHHYVIGVYSSLKAACEAGLEHEQYRGGCGKYMPRITMTKVDSDDLRTVVDGLEEARHMLKELTGDP